MRECVSTYVSTYVRVSFFNQQDVAYHHQPDSATPALLQMRNIAKATRAKTQRRVSMAWTVTSASVHTVGRAPSVKWVRAKCYRVLNNYPLSACQSDSPLVLLTVLLHFLIFVCLLVLPSYLVVVDLCLSS